MTFWLSFKIPAQNRISSYWMGSTMNWSKPMMTTNALLNPSRFEGWSTTVEEAKAAGTPMILSDIPVHREQAPNARFVGQDDAPALADAIEQSPVRDIAAIAGATKAAAPMNLQNQHRFALSVSEVVREAARAGKSNL